VPVIVCPLCFSKNIVLFVGGYAGKIYRCLDCGYVGPLVLEVEDKEYERLRSVMRLRERRA